MLLENLLNGIFFCVVAKKIGTALSLTACNFIGRTFAIDGAGRLGNMSNNSFVRFMLISGWIVASLLIATGAIADCIPTSCIAEAKNCGTIDNGCSGKLHFGNCSAPNTCGGRGIENVCGTPRSGLSFVAATGAAISETDPVVAKARTKESDMFYSFGFDIATGIFGDPALGALGNTLTGPGSLRIRDALNAAGQRGFNASLALHFSRNYRK